MLFDAQKEGDDDGKGHIARYMVGTINIEISTTAGSIEDTHRGRDKWGGWREETCHALMCHNITPEATFRTASGSLVSHWFGRFAFTINLSARHKFGQLSKLIFLMPRSDYLPLVLLMFSLIYFRSSSGSSINSSTIVGSIQTENLVVFQFHLCATISCFPYDSTDNFPSSHSLDSAVCYRPTASRRNSSVIVGYLRNPSVTSGLYQKSWHKGIGSASPNSVCDSVVFVHGT